MSDPSLSNPAIDPDQSVIASQQAQPLTSQNVQGNTLLDAEMTAGEDRPEGEPIEAPIATNFSGATATIDPTTAGVSGEMGA